jgi:hypothetical protein
MNKSINLRIFHRVGSGRGKGKKGEETSGKPAPLSRLFQRQRRFIGLLSQL